MGPLFTSGFSFNIQHKIVNAFEAGDNRKACYFRF
jgi:hypothetical protein